MPFINKWESVSHAIDVSIMLISRYRDLEWAARGNTLKTESTSVTDDDMKNSIQHIFDENEALTLANNL